MIINIILGVVIVLLFFAFHQKRTIKYCRSKKRLDGKTVIVTGGTSGMGLEISADIAERGARVIVACPFEDEGARGTKMIIDRSGNKNVIYKFLDLKSMESVKTFAKEIMENEDRLDILFNNAGTGSGCQFLTKDGMNFIMAVNYYGTYLLTLLLLPLLRKTGTPDEPARIVNTSSLMLYIGVIDIDNINVVNKWTSARLYSNSKLCLTSFSGELAKRLGSNNVVINSLHPGLVGTPIFTTYIGNLGHILAIFLRYFCKTPWEGAQTALHVGLDKRAGTVSGQFFMNCAVSRAKAIAYDSNTATRLWEHSAKIVQLDEQTIKDLID